MGSIRARNGSGNLFLDFRYQGVRCREQTLLANTPENRRKLQKLLERVEAEITLGIFDYEKYFPGSKRSKQFEQRKAHLVTTSQSRHNFNTFCEQWFVEMEPQWRRSHRMNIRQTLDRYLIPSFGSSQLEEITKAQILNFRSGLVRPDEKRAKALSPSRINHIMTPLRMILNEAADRYNFTSPYRNITPIKVPRTDVEPFTIEEVQTLLNKVREDFYCYYLTRFFTGLRTAEIDGLKWKYVDLKRRKILIRETIVDGHIEYPKNDGSFREVDMSEKVLEAMIKQRNATGMREYVFCNKFGGALAHSTVTRYIWYPLLRHLGFKKRRPYQTRHTAATLWLAAGESPEWIAKQMGHSSTEMLFKTYSRFVPNLTRQDGSAFDKLIDEHFNQNDGAQDRADG